MLKLAIQNIKYKNTLITVIPELDNNQLIALNKIINNLLQNSNHVKVVFNNKSTQSSIIPIQLEHKFTNSSGILKVLTFVLFNPIRIITWLFRIKFKNPVFKSSFIDLMSKVNQAIICVSDFDCLICWNPYCSTYGVMADVFKWKRKEVYTIEYGPFPGTLIIDEGFIVNSYNLKKFPYFKNLNSINVEKFELKTTNLYSQNEAILPRKIEESKKMKILFLGLSEVDSGVYPSWGKERKLFYPYFKDGLHGALELATYFEDILFVYKPHPNHNLHSTDAELKNNLWIINGDATELINWADIVIGNGTKVENDVLIMKKPLVNFGAGFCWNSGLSNIVNSISDFELFLEKYKNNQIKIPAETELNNWFNFLKGISY